MVYSVSFAHRSAMLGLFLAIVLRSLSVRGYSIYDEHDLVRFSELVNTGNTFQGITLFIRNDLDMEGIGFVPIGSINNYNDHFSGIFDGQGHIISNLNVSSDKSSVGLFGNCVSSTIKNVVLDDTCSVKAIFSRSDEILNVGGVIGTLVAYKGYGSIESVINMGSIIVPGKTGGTL